MGILDFFGKRQLTLDVATFETWPDKLLRYSNLDKNVRAILKDLERNANNLKDIRSSLTSVAGDERTQPVLDEHVPALIAAIEELAQHANFIEDIYLLEDQQAGLQAALSAYRERAAKSIAALKEHAPEHLQELDNRVRTLEDNTIKITQVLEEGKYENIKNVRELVEKFNKSRKREEKLLDKREEFLTKLQQLEEKRERIGTKLERLMGDNPQYLELFKKEDALHQQMDDLEQQTTTEKELETKTQAIQQEMHSLRKECVNDITALNISEQRHFLRATEQDIRKAKINISRIDDALEETSFQRYIQLVSEHLQPFPVRIEQENTIFESGDVAPQ